MIYLKQHKFNKQRILSLLPFIFIVLGIFLFFKYGRNISPKEILDLAPENYFAASIYLLVIFAFKSLSIVFPILVLYVSSGMIFPLYLAIIVNIIGIAIALSIPYSIGYFSRNKSPEDLYEKYPKLQQINSISTNNETLFVFLIRIIGIMPMDVVSIYMGSTGVPFKKHLIISILAMLPNLLATTFMGATIFGSTTTRFLLSCAFKITISATSIILYKKYKKA